MSDNSINALAEIDAFVSKRYGTYFEAEIFASISNCLFVVRAFEFALADGALLATAGLSPPSNRFSERFWQLNEDVRVTRYTAAQQDRILIPFDIKSSVGSRAEDQVYITTTRQRSKVGFYISVCATHPDYVEIHPNQRSSGSLDARKIAVNFSRKSHLRSSAYGSLSPCNSPYRMPLGLLPLALESLRSCARGEGDYVNPWTGVQFPGWTPHTEHDNENLIPREDSQHYTSFKGVMEIWRCIRAVSCQRSIPIEFELVQLQPRLADFKLLVPGKTQSQRRQVFVQYKIDGLYRSPTSPLSRVCIARLSSGRLHHYFATHERCAQHTRLSLLSLMMIDSTSCSTNSTIKTTKEGHSPSSSSCLRASCRMSSTQRMPKKQISIGQSSNHTGLRWISMVDGYNGYTISCVRRRTLARRGIDLVDHNLFKHSQQRACRGCSRSPSSR